MRYSFNLNKPSSQTETVIFFVCHFKKEKRKFKYSIQKSICPLNWDFKNRSPNTRGENVAKNYSGISKRMRAFEDEFGFITGNSALGQVAFDSHVLKDHFDRVFKKEHTASSFFEVYDKFTNERIKLKEWKKGTVKRYANIKNLLLEFEGLYKYKLTFNTINSRFFTLFTDFCYEDKNHYINTYSRNVGLLKTFMFWSVNNGYTYNDEFRKFKKPQRILTREEVLSLEEILELYSFDCGNNSLEKVRDSFVFQCLTGMRYGELKLVNKRILTPDNCIILKEEKNSSKPPRLIPLSKIAFAILAKYDHKLPLLSDQKQNEAIKKLIKKFGLIHEVEYSRTKGVVQELFVKNFYERISTHTARRSFITIMRNKGIADKIIMGMTGHTDIKSFNQYHQVDDTARINAINTVFDGD